MDPTCTCTLEPIWGEIFGAKIHFQPVLSHNFRWGNRNWRETWNPGWATDRLMWNASSNEYLEYFICWVYRHTCSNSLSCSLKESLLPWKYFPRFNQFLWLRRSFERSWVETVIIFLRKAIMWRYYDDSKGQWMAWKRLTRFVCPTIWTSNWRSSG